MIAYRQQKNIPVKASAAKPYSSDENCLHISYEAGQLENLSVNGVELVDFGMTTLPQKAPDRVEPVTVAFESGVPVAVGGKKMTAFEIVRTLNQVGGRNGIGQIDMVENRFVGMKSRGVYEAPGMTILYHAHRVLEQITMDRDLMHLRDRLAPEVAEMVYYGFWYHAKMDALFAFITGPATGHRRSDPESVQRQSWWPAHQPQQPVRQVSPRWKAARLHQTDAEGFAHSGLARPRAAFRPRATDSQSVSFQPPVAAIRTAH